MRAGLRENGRITARRSYGAAYPRLFADRRAATGAEGNRVLRRPVSGQRIGRGSRHGGARPKIPERRTLIFLPGRTIFSAPPCRVSLEGQPQ